MSVTTTGDIAKLLYPGVSAVFGETYDAHESQWKKLFNVENSKLSFDTDVQFEGFGLASETPEGAGVRYDTRREGFSPKYQHKKYTLGYMVSEEAIDDNQYNLFTSRSVALADSMNETKENVCANIYNNAFSTSYLMTDGDGKPLLATDHPNGPTSTGTYSNMLPVPAALSEVALEDALIQIKEATNPRGLRIALKGMSLHIPPKLCFEGTRILQSVLQSGTANNSVNAIRQMGMLPEGQHVNNYFTSDTAWFIRTNVRNGLKFKNRQAVRFQMDNDFGTSNARYKASERYSAGWSDPRGLYGSQGL